jgi:hypothetical protein
MPMKIKLCTLFFILVLSVTLIGVVRRTEATLGGSVNSVATDRRMMTAVRGTTTVHNGYTVHEFETSSTTVREYVSAKGIVFGLSWKGLMEPDLTQLLGSYASDYLNALARSARRHGSRQLQIKTRAVVVEKWGHMRSLQGRAYTPDLIPPGVSIDEIR